MINFRLIILNILALCSCFGPFAFNNRGPSEGPAPVLRSHFESKVAAVELKWSRASDSGFVRYQIQRQEGDSFRTIAEIVSNADTTYVVQNIDADIVYRYRINSVFDVGDNLHFVASNVVSGIIHRYVDSWKTSSEFIPTRVAIGPNRITHVLGVGAGRIERFNEGGNMLSSLVYSEAPLACMETSVLDGPSLAIDGDGNVFVAYNLSKDGGRSQAYWSKYKYDGNLLWTRPLDGLFARHILIDGEDVFVETLSQLQHFDRDGNLQTQHLIPALLVSSLRIWQGRFAALIEPISLLDSDWNAPRLVVYDTADRRQASLVIGRDEKSKIDRGRGVLRRPTDFAVDEMEDRAFIVNAAQDRIEVYRDGKYLTRWGDWGSDPGEFSFKGDFAVIDDIETGDVVLRSVVAGGIARDGDGYIYVADSFNNRIQRFYP
ncbi:MAG: hypothetical protein VX294_09300 [Candidatus Latescibacterota bacterium]|nr:hypothetical protein [Candidatus Latescibacterota bacterium]